LQPAGEAPDRAEQQCTFANQPDVPYYWEPECSSGKLGCFADGIHEACRFCAQRPFEEIPCPVVVAPPVGRCTFAGGVEPSEMHFWDPSCEMGLLGCWADGRHKECRFCGGTGAYRNVSCPAAVEGGSQSGLSSEAVGASGARAPSGGSGLAVSAAKDMKAEPEQDARAESISEVDLSRSVGRELFGFIVAGLVTSCLAWGL
jgi:hypothetical protein